jgi:hypothetical protein
MRAPPAPERAAPPAAVESREGSADARHPAAAAWTAAGVPALVHVALGLWVVAMLLTARLAPAAYDGLVQEDRLVEWWTVFLFLAAAALGARRALRGRRAFDALVALFCFFVAGEEVSWGQRLAGYTPPEFFLANNTQQEANLHNFHGALGKPKWLLIAALVGYGVILPAAAWLAEGARGGRRAGAPRLAARVLDTLGASAPPRALAPWFATAVALLVWYPVEFTGEWVEAMSGGLFLAALPLGGAALGGSAAVGLVAAALLTAVGGRMVRSGGAEGARLACARAEVDALLADVTRGRAAAEPLYDAGRVHKRAWTMGEDGYLALDAARQLAATRCAGEDPESGARRRRYAVDPWGTAYWIDVRRRDDEGQRRVTVYSFGPNRRRDGAGAPGTSDDDVAAVGALTVMPADSTAVR